VPAALNLLVFREGRQRVCGPELKAALLLELQSLRERSTPDEVLARLLRAGELECAVADSGAAPAQPYMSVTDRLAEALLVPDSSLNSMSLQVALAEAAMPEALNISPPEGFAYYALHPLAFADVLARVPGLKARVAVIGIRTIGVTLSAVAAAAARARGLAAERITVRPEGHPYNRRTRLSPEQIEFIRQDVALDAAFVVVDEGPGLSGSTFISVAEELEEAGAPRERITLVCGREPDFDSLRADDGPRRGRRFRWVAASSEPLRPCAAEIALGGGQWRKHLLPDEMLWPASWTTLERLKYSSVAQGRRRRFFKFQGFGHYGDRVIARERRVADEGFGPVPRRESTGFASYSWIAGRPMAAADISPDVIARLAAYCAFRARAFARNLSDLSALERMPEHNARELGLETSLRLRLERPVLADGRMQPHEWLRAGDGRMLKTDSGSHGDDHFFPGATDIAWDLAGAIVEWNMSPAHARAFLEAYRGVSGDDPGPRIGGFITAYALFRCAHCKMAADALRGSEEAPRLERAAALYHALLSHRATEEYLASLP
jgi:hypothetical protein